MIRKMQKKEIRTSIYQMRREMTDERWKDLTDKITRRVVEMPMFLEAKELYCYVDYKHEVGTRKMIQTAWHLNKNVFVPKVQGREMEFFKISGFDDLKDGMKGIQEPFRTSKAEKGAGEEGLMIMPGVAFDRELHRIGYGGGFYDRYLEKHQNLQKIAVAFEYQIFEELPSETFDICPDKIITETSVYERKF